MVVELATIILALKIKQYKGTNHRLLNLSMLFTMWALVYHLHLAFANFLDPRVWVVELMGMEIILHFIFAGSALLIMLPIMRAIAGDNGIISLAALLLASQILFIILVPQLVDLMMGSQHCVQARFTKYCLGCSMFTLVTIFGRIGHQEILHHSITQFL